jgi:uncharacterized pyridoxamine 5'-phosphate oxidase family protein
MENRNYELETHNIYDQMGEAKLMALAISSNGRTTVRMMSCIKYDGKIMFQTSVDLLKYNQICKNNNVALCFDNISIEGIANIIGKTSDEKNQEIMNIYKKHYEKSYKTYSRLDKERLIEVVPTKITKWDYDRGLPYRIFIDAQEKTAGKELYSLEDERV